MRSKKHYLVRMSKNITTFILKETGNENFLYSGSMDGTIKKWNLETNRVAAVLKITAGCQIFCMAIFDKFLYIGDQYGICRIDLLDNFNIHYVYSEAVIHSSKVFIF